MKIFGGIITGIVLSVMLLPATPAEAAACSNVSSFGAVALTVPRLPILDDRLIWLRIEAPTPQAQILVQVNDDECLTIGGHEQAPGQWSWQTSRKDGVVAPLAFDRAENNTLKIIGISDGVKVDRVVITGSDCVPQDFGANCQYVQAVREDEGDIPTQLPSPAAEAVRGPVLLSTTPEKMKDELDSLKYVIDGRVIQGSKKPVPFDTTRIGNGKHTVQIVTTLKDGRIIRESTVIEVDNPENSFSPLVRWLRLYSETLVRVGAVLGMCIVLVAGARLIRLRRTKKRERRFHGF